MHKTNDFKYSDKTLSQNFSCLKDLFVCNDKDFVIKKRDYRHTKTENHQRVKNYQNLSFVLLISLCLVKTRKFALQILEFQIVLHP